MILEISFICFGWIVSSNCVVVGLAIDSYLKREDSRSCNRGSIGSIERNAIWFEGVARSVCDAGRAFYLSHTLLAYIQRTVHYANQHITSCFASMITA